MCLLQLSIGFLESLYMLSSFIREGKEMGGGGAGGGGRGGGGVGASLHPGALVDVVEDRSRRGSQNRGLGLGEAFRGVRGVRSGHWPPIWGSPRGEVEETELETAWAPNWGLYRRLSRVP